MKLNELTIVIVTYKSDNKLDNCLKTISDNVSVIVVENSKDENLKTKFKKIS